MEDHAEFYESSLRSGHKSDRAENAVLFSGLEGSVVEAVVCHSNSPSGLKCSLLQLLGVLVGDNFQLSYFLKIAFR